MLTIERRDLILALLNKQDVVSVQELVKETSASESTIRRDLTELENDQYIKRVHGGASLRKKRSEELTVAEKTSRHQNEKKHIAREAAKEVQQGACIYLDAGTTTFEMIPFLQDKQVVVVTNGIPHVTRLMEYGISTYVIGGRTKAGTAALVGPRAAEALQAYRFDCAFLGMNGVDPFQGYTTPDPDEAFVKKTALSLTARRFVLADHSKVGEASFASVGHLNEATFVTSSLLDPEKKEALMQKTEVKVVQL
ncbi:DeoR/GlpR family DNA-binding transcription regulator [Aureibacillus halotolerans]|uniref:DeoR family transcriptional regulator n=1 Tax=Aureibacillus halotolerans TaxID=1508390 RepID=A0A4V3D676_9BACI|nr:DeoR/GlpR family DNA-binding transcription regulator [Aureibacillus halotolerans]TDQ42887.1 DeoR family transcriptional regulator [Aureibacillus halotolerans]